MLAVFAAAVGIMALLLALLGGMRSFWPDPEISAEKWQAIE